MHGLNRYTASCLFACLSIDLLIIIEIAHKKVVQRIDIESNKYKLSNFFSVGWILVLSVHSSLMIYSLSLLDLKLINKCKKSQRSVGRDTI